MRALYDLITVAILVELSNKEINAIHKGKRTYIYTNSIANLIRSVGKFWSKETQQV